MNVIQCLQILLEETTEELETSLINTATRIRELDPDDERDHGLLWGFRDNIQAIWEDSAVQVTNNRQQTVPCHNPQASLFSFITLIN